MNFYDRIQKSIENLQDLKNDTTLYNTLEKVVFETVKSLQNGGRLLICGNGGSAADAQHIAAELSGRFKIDRKPIDAEALHVNTSYLTSVANDYGYEVVYERLVEAKGRKGDVLIAISTSGNSDNIIRALKMAKYKNMTTVGFTGKNGGKMKDFCDYIIKVPSNDTPIIQEMHIIIGHVFCEDIEKYLI